MLDPMRLASPPPLRPCRVHEVGGPAAAGFAVRVAAGVAGHVLWVAPAWLPEQIDPLGFEGLDPARVLLARTASPTDTLAVAEEALRDGSVALVVAQVTAPLSLTAGRRLQLAAAEGRATGLCLIPEGMGSNAAETRWHAAPVFDAEDSTLQCWSLIKNKSGTTGRWNVRWDAQARRVAVVSPAGQRPGGADAPG